MDKWLSSFPRPPHDSGRGIHWSPNQYKWGKERWDFWRDFLIRTDMKWVKLLDDGSGSALGLVMRLLDLNIMPVIRLFREEPNPGRIDAGNLDYVARCVKLGAFYFETNNEPDLALEWENKNRPEDWLEIVVDNFIVEASQIRDIGGWLLFPAFGPGGRGNPFQMIVDRGRKDLLDGNCCLAIHNYCLGRPLDYPNDRVNMFGVPLTQEEWEATGGMWAWEMGVDTINEHRRNLANPNANIMEDSTCFRAYEYFDALVNEAAGHSIPIFTTEGGYNVGQRAGTTAGDDPRYPKPTPQRMSELTVEMLKAIESGPPYYFGCMPWLAGVSAFGHGATNFEAQGPWVTGWFNRDWDLDGELPIVGMLKRTPGVGRTGPIRPARWDRFDRLKYMDREIDYRIGYLEPQVSMVSFVAEGGQYWKLTRMEWQDHWQGASGNIFVRCLDEDGKITEGQEVLVSYGMDGEFHAIKTKGEIDAGYGDFPMNAGLGSYNVYLEGNSDKVVGLGMGNEIGYERTSFFLTFQLVNAPQRIAFDFLKYRQTLKEREELSESYGVVVEREKGDGKTARLIGVHHLLPEENNGRHHFFVEVLNENGERDDKAIVCWKWKGQKPNDIVNVTPMHGVPEDELPKIAMLPNEVITAWVASVDAGDSVGNVHAMHPAEPGEGNYENHHSFYALWQIGFSEPQEAELDEGKYQKKYEGLYADLTAVVGDLETCLQELGRLFSQLLEMLEEYHEN